MRTKFVVYKDNLQPLRNKKIERFIYQIILDISILIALPLRQDYPTNHSKYLVVLYYQMLLILDLAEV